MSSKKKPAQSLPVQIRTPKVEVGIRTESRNGVIYGDEIIELQVQGNRLKLAEQLRQLTTVISGTQEYNDQAVNSSSIIVVLRKS